MPTADTVEVRPRKNPLTSIKRVRGESRQIVLAHDEAGGRIAARLVKIGTGGVDRQTGEPLRTYWETTAKVPMKGEVTRTFRHERNARIAYLAAQHGVQDFSTPLGDVGPRLWAEPGNLTALSKLGETETAPRTRVNSGDSDAIPPIGAVPAPTTRPAIQTALFGLPWWTGSASPVWSAPEPRTAPMFREVPVADLEAEEAAVLTAARAVA